MITPAPGTHSPADGTQLPRVDPTSLDELADRVARARHAQTRWAQRSLDERVATLERAVRRMLDRADEITDILSAETGKSRTDALMSEVVGLGPYFPAAVKEARVALAPVKVRLSPLDYPKKSIVTDVVPRGVVGIIAPWNYALSNFFKPVFPALLAGNAVILKPSEYTPRAGAWLCEQLAAELPMDLVSVAQGSGDVGARLIELVDAITFTGSVATGRKVAARAAERFIPCSAELGGNDAAIVVSDCDLTRTVAGVAQWGFHNCGQNCAAIERVYVEDAVADRFVRQIGALADALTVSPQGEHADISPLQSQMQLDTVERHVADAVAKGATVVAGGEATGEGLGYRPTVLDGCDDTMLVMQEETFGPVIAIQRVTDAERGVDFANASHYGLNGSVWTSNITRGRELAGRLEVGVAYVNNHSFAGALAGIPWTGVKDTGTGIAASRFSYHTFTRPRTMFVDSNTAPDPWWFPLDGNLAAMGDLLLARARGSMSAALKIAPLLGKRVKAIQKLAGGD